MSVWFFNESQKSMIWMVTKARKIQKTYRRRNYNPIIRYEKHHFSMKIKDTNKIMKKGCILFYKKEKKRLPRF